MSETDTIGNRIDVGQPAAAFKPKLVQLHAETDLRDIGQVRGEVDPEGTESNQFCHAAERFRAWAICQRQSGQPSKA